MIYFIGGLIVQYVTLVDKDNIECGICEKIKAHIEKKLHRAFSVFIFNDKGELLIQKRAKHKYHSGNLWSNSCCSHPEYGKDIIAEVKNRVRCELGIESTNIRRVFDIIYDVDLGEMHECEYDYVYFADYVSGNDINLDEVQEVKWISLADLYVDVRDHPDSYTYWFKKILTEKITYFFSVDELFVEHKETILQLITDSVKQYGDIPPNILEEFNYSVKNVGKMKRSYLMTVIYYMITSKENSNLNYLMAAVELMQNASLIHDDIIDKALIRRGKESVVNKYGVNSAIIIGDYLIFCANSYLCKFAQIESNYVEIMSVLNDAFSQMCLGEKIEGHIHNIDTSLKLYKQVIYLKTASFFSAICKVAAIFAGASYEEVIALENFGSNFGVAYQMKDDILPYIDKEIDKDINNDINRKLVTLPIIYAYANGNIQEKRFIESWMEAEENDQAVIEELKVLIAKNLGQCIETIRAYIDEAKRNLSIFKDNEAKRILVNLIDNL